MAVMIAEVYDALKDAGASEDKARRAAETLASYENRFAALDRRFDELRLEFEALKGQVKLLTWMVGFNLAVSVTMLFKMFA